MTLTKNDLNQIENIVDRKLDEKLDEKLQTQKEEIFTEIDIKLQNLKSDFFEKIDPILKEVTTAREERPLIENRLEKLEEIHLKGKHVLTP